MSSVPPPPPYNTPPTPPGWGQPPAAPPAYELGVGSGKPPRPIVKVGAILTLVGGAMLLLAAFLPWFESSGTSLNGLDKYILDDNGIPKKLDAPGGTWVFFGIVLIAFGLTMVLAGRVLAVAILSIIAGGLGLVSVAVGWSGANDTKKFVESSLCERSADELRQFDGIDVGCGTGTFKAGLPVGLVGAGIGLAGGIACTAKRRRRR